MGPHYGQPGCRVLHCLLLWVENLLKEVFIAFVTFPIQSNKKNLFSKHFTCDVDLSDGVSQATVTYVLCHICYLPPCGGLGIEFSQPAIHNLHHCLTVTAYLTHTQTHMNTHTLAGSINTAP